MSAPDASTPTSAEALDPRATMAAIEDGVVVRWWQVTTFLRVDGPDAASFLDGLCTQAVERIEPRTAVLGLFLDAKAKIIAPTVLHRLDTEAFALETLPELVDPLHRHLKKYRLRAKATLEPADASSIGVLGAGADDLVSSLGPIAGTWTRRSDRPAPSWTLVADAATCRAVVHDVLPAAGAQPADPGAFEAHRIESGAADLHDLLPGRMPAEVGGMQTAVALDAGCYLGQEPVARLHYRGHANRTLRRLYGDAAVTPAPAPAGDDGAPDLDAALALRRPTDSVAARPAGRLTTWAAHPDGGTVALGVVRREVGADEHLVLAGTDTVLVTRDAPDAD